MVKQLQYRSSKSRVTKQQEEYNLLNNQILNYIKGISEEKEAETLWFEMKAQGIIMSNRSFNTRLKKLVEAGVIEKISIGYNKNLYRALEV